MAIEFTKPQENAIEAASGALVSAAAGSGKTAVLVERVIRKLCGENPIDADRLLVVTFTDAAAREMRMRIEKRIGEECRKHPDNHFLVKQKLQLRSAKICTIDSFCIELVRENFDRLGINPDFSIADEGYLVVLAENTLTEVLNECFDNNSEEFKTLAAAVSNDFDEGDLRGYIKGIYRFAQNMPFPDEWISEQLKRCREENAISDTFDTIFQIAEKKVIAAYKKMQFAIKALDDYGDPANQLLQNFNNGSDDIEILLKHVNERNFDKLNELVSTFKFDDLPRIKGINNIPEAVSAKNLREEAKAIIESLKNIFYTDYASAEADLKFSAELTETLLKLTLQYSKAFALKREEKNIMTFSDTEHLALKLLCEYSDGDIVLREDASNIINCFDEVLVDEFQDTNNMQNILFSVLADNESKLFVVGDLKQSIYRFRGANPKNFNEKKERYIDYDKSSANDLKRIILGNNFRSREGVCDFVNFFFDIMMTGKKSLIQYDKDDHLIFSAKDYPTLNQPDVEVAFIEPENARNTTEPDAKNIAAFIHKFMAEGQLTDKNTKMPRKPKFSDFTILFRNLSSKGTAYAMELEKYGIPVSYSLDGYTENAEVQMIFSLLKAIENPTRSIELVATMMSPIFMFTAEQIAQIRLTKKGGDFISAVITAAEKGDTKCQNFLNKLNLYSNMAATSSIGDLLNFIYDDTGILNVVSVLDKGGNRRSNLLLLNSLAATYDSNTSLNNLSVFIEYIIKLSEKNIKGAGVSAGEDSVTLMTIHKSKGLQFPVCIIADTATSFSHADTSDKLLVDEVGGVSFKFNPKSDSSLVSPLSREVISGRIRDEQLAEELRLLYVAFTRAEEKLFVSVPVKDVEERLMQCAVPVIYSDSYQKYSDLITYGNSYAAWLISALAVHQSSQDIFKQKNMFKLANNDSLKISVNFDKELTVEGALAEETEIEVLPNLELANRIADALAYEYPYESLKNIESKASVTELAHKAEKGDFSFTSSPAFLSAKGMTAAQIGTATHRFMQFADFENAKRDLEGEIERLYEWQFITFSEKQAINTEAVSKFFDSELYRRIANAERIEREMRFLTEIEAGQINDQLPEDIKKEKIVVQGSVDCVFVEDDQIVVIDFKTDRIKSEDELNAAYGEQLDIYAKACQKIFEMPIKEKLIYSFALGKAIKQ
ncbi:MAG: helicase-exonuclease AddAB subunit AddA [Acutalibacteraceae bacterium]|nr:helicase-exonuclease AddAB subunit AddA [Acutalibacteraceae bacterium]